MAGSYWVRNNSSGYTRNTHFNTLLTTKDCSPSDFSRDFRRLNFAGFEEWKALIP